jgi:hypothetical protein
MTVTQQISVVRAGDLIRADDYNLMITLVNDLADRVEKLEAGGITPTDGSPVITSITPMPPRVGDTVLIVGSHFDYSIGSARASLDGLDLGLLNGSSDTTLIFLLPALSALPDGGRTMTLVVKNSQSATTRSILVLPELPQPQGIVTLQFQDTNPEVVTAGQQCVFHYQFISGANLPVTLEVTKIISVPAWQGGMQVLDDTGAVVPDNRITVGSLLTKDFYVRVAGLTGPIGPGTAFNLTVGGSGQGLVAKPDTTAFVVGQRGAQDHDTRFSVSAVQRSGPGGNPFSGGAITLKVGESAEVDLLLGFSRAGTFTVTTSVLSPGSGWAIADIPPPFVVTAGDIPGTGPSAGWKTDTGLFTITAPATAGSSDLLLILQRQGGTTPRTIMLHLVAQA